MQFIESFCASDSDGSISHDKKDIQNRIFFLKLTGNIMAYLQLKYDLMIQLKVDLRSKREQLTFKKSKF